MRITIEVASIQEDASTGENGVVDEVRLPDNAVHQSGLGLQYAAREPVDCPSALERSVGRSDESATRLPGFPVDGFRLALQTVSASAVTSDEIRLRDNQVLAEGEGGRQRALSALLGVIGQQQRVVIIHAIKPDEVGRPCYRLSVEGMAAACTAQGAAAQAERLCAEVTAALAIGYPQFGFRRVEQPTGRAGPLATSGSERLACVVHVVPACLELGTSKRGVAGFTNAIGESERNLLALAPVVHQSFLDGVVAAMMASPHEVQLRIELTGRTFSHDSERSLAELLDGICNLDVARARLLGAGVRPASPSMLDLAGIHAWMRHWLVRPLGVDMQVSVHSAAPLPVTLLRPMVAEVMQGRGFSLSVPDQPCGSTDALDLSRYLPADGPMPPLLPSPASLGRLGVRRHFGEVRLRTPHSGVLLGNIPTAFADEPVRLGAADRAQHCYLLGATGTGKSTLLLNMIAQDIEAGHGVALLDPHGDLYREVLARVPETRQSDVVLVDFTEFDNPPGLNLLELKTQRRELERNFIIQDLTKILQRLYGSVPESMGPMFFMYMRNAVALVMADPHANATLLDVPRVFSDSSYRAYLLQNCAEAGICEFWRGIAGPATGDSSLLSIAPYIVNKFTEFTQNALVRSVVGQPKTTIDLRAAMDHKKILLVNLSKGLLSELDTRFLGMLLTGRLFAAAASRADTPACLRTTFHVYIDEFQNFTSDAITTMLTEARKYGLAVTVAHQELGQLSREMRDALLANTGSKMMFRVSCADAEVLASYIAPHYTAQDLMTLPDHCAMARIKIDNVPSPVFVMETLPASVRAFVQSAAEQRAIPPAPTLAAAPKEDMQARRDAFLKNLKFDEELLDASSCAALATEGAHGMSDLMALSATAQVELLSKLKSTRDRVLLRGLVRRFPKNPSISANADGLMPAAA